MSVFDFDESLFAPIPNGFVVYRLVDEEIIYANEEAVALFDCANQDEFLEYVSYHFQYMIRISDVDQVKSQISLQVSKSNAFHYVCFHILTKNNVSKYIESYGKKFIQDDVEYIAITLLDSHQKQESFQLDKVTGLAGTYKFLDDVSEYLKKHVYDDKFYSIIYFNFSNFKTYNMRYGMEKGDLFLCDVAAILREMFPDHPLARLEDDHFGALVETKLLEFNIEEIQKNIQEKYPEEGLDVKVGIYPLMVCEVDNIKEIIRFAQVASDSIKRVNGVSYQFYNDELGKDRELQEYVVAHINEAVDNEWIKVYYQPVIRTISGNLCGAEALARWDDPVYGLLPPGKFIPALENSRKIHILDSFMIHKVCEHLARRIENKEKVVPISFNLSRLDFYLTDIFKIIDDEVTYYQLPHDDIKIELTESIIASDTETMRKEITRFKEAGYDVWMDDFGTGYSSLNLLKDFSFDELKLDMAFISDFSEKSKDIILSTIKMAKKIKIQTLAEGVETFEQYDFLKHIGCEKVQGYYFGKPTTYNKMVEDLLSKGVKIEDRMFKTYYDAFTKIDFISDSPIAIIEYYHDNFKVRFANDVTLSKFSSLSISDEKKFEEMLNSSNYYFSRKISDFISKPIHSGKEEYLYFTYNGVAYKFDIRLVAKSNDRYMFVFRCHNITNNESNVAGAVFDSVIRDISQLYDAIAVIDVEKNTYATLFEYSPGSKTVYHEDDFHLSSHNFCEKYIYFEDQERYFNFIDPKNFTQAVKKSKDNFITNYFRTYTKENTFIWKEVTILKIKLDDKDKYLLLFKPVDWNQEDLVDALVDKEENVDECKHELSNEAKVKLFDLIMKNTDVNYFWKDSSRRFLGASNAFLKTFGFDSLDKILGKTDEDMKWHINDEAYHDDEINVVENGTVIKDSLGKCIINGVPKTILASKWPIYANNRIEGLFGYFRDVEESKFKSDYNLSTIDPLTRLNNIRGFMQNLLEYSDEYNRIHRDFCLTLLSFTSLEEINQNYGEKTFKETSKIIANNLLNICGTNCSIARITNSKYVIIRYIDSKDDVVKYEEAMTQAFKKVHMVNNNPITLYVNIVHSLASEYQNNPERIYQSVLFKTGEE